MGKAKRFNSYDHKVFQDRQVTEAYAKIRQDVAGIGSSFRDSPSGAAFTSSKPNLLEKDTSSQLQGALGFDRGFNTISNGVLQLDVIAGIINQSKSYMAVIPEGLSGSDILDNLTGRSVKGQIVVLTAFMSSGAITITDRAGSAGQFVCPDGVDYTLTNGNSVWIVDDPTFTPQTWRVIGVASGGASGDNLGNHTATTNLLMNGNDIYFDTPGDDKFQHVGTSIYVWNNAVNTFRFAQTVIQTHVNFRPSSNSLNLGDSTHKWKDIYLNSGDKTSKIFFDGGGDTYLTGSNTSGNINVYNNNILNTNFNTSGIATTGLSMTGNILLQGNDINMAGGDVNMTSGDVDFSAGGTIDFTDIKSTGFASGGAEALPSLPTAYFRVEFAGQNRYIPYFTAS